MPTGNDADSKNASTKIAIKRPILHHVNLKTARMQQMIDWYTEVIGVDVVFQNPVVAFTTNDAANHRIALLTSPLLCDDPEWRIHVGVHHLAFEYGSVDDLLDTWTRLRDDLGLEPHMSLNHGPTLSFYYVDPDGNSVELQADCFGDWAASKKFINSSPEFAANPIGEFVDPAKMVAARSAGATGDELLRRAYAGEFPPSAPPDLRIALPAS
jgi:catechol 2,3-dioxygenase